MAKSSKKNLFSSLTLWVCIILFSTAFYVGKFVHPVWFQEKISLDVQKDSKGKLFYIFKGKEVPITDLISYENAQLNESHFKNFNLDVQPDVTEEIAFVDNYNSDTDEFNREYYMLHAKKHWKFWSLLPALMAVILCWLTREPIISLLCGVISGALILGEYNIPDNVMLPTMMSKNAAGVLLLYLWLLGGLMGLWSKTGAARAFADFMTEKFVKGPRSAKLVAWFLGVVFFQGGTVSTVLVGTTVKPIADKEKISHEELSYIVDSTASPIASQLAFNAWPSYIQAFIYVSGVSWLATETDRIRFFFKSVPFCFYAIFAVTMTFLLSIEKFSWLHGSRLRKAMNRARKKGQLDAPDASPLSAKELAVNNVPKGYKSSVWEFFIPLGLLISVAIGTFITSGSPKVRIAFTFALVSAFFMALIKGMSIKDLVGGMAEGIKGVVVGSIILILAIMIGNMSKLVGGGFYLVELLGNQLPFWTLPVLLQLITVIMAFSTGTSWGTYAVTFPLAMPLAWAVCQAQGLAHPEFFMTICFAAVMDGSVYGDQCSPISDTTVLSSMCTGCDLMDHVKSQIPPATVAAIAAGCLWTTLVYFFA